MIDMVLSPNLGSKYTSKINISQTSVRWKPHRIKKCDVGFFLDKEHGKIFMSIVKCFYQKWIDSDTKTMLHLKLYKFSYTLFYDTSFYNTFFLQ